LANTIQHTDGLELWVWDTGEVEGFALFMDGVQIDPGGVEKIKYVIPAPQGQAEYVVQFAGLDGGATKMVDAKNANRVLGFQDTGMSHAYTVVR